MPSPALRSPKRQSVYLTSFDQAKRCVRGSAKSDIKVLYNFPAPDLGNGSVRITTLGVPYTRRCAASRLKRFRRGSDVVRESENDERWGAGRRASPMTGVQVLRLKGLAEGLSAGAECAESKLWRSCVPHNVLKQRSRWQIRFSG